MKHQKFLKKILHALNKYHVGNMRAMRQKKTKYKLGISWFAMNHSRRHFFSFCYLSNLAPVLRERDFPSELAREHPVPITLSRHATNEKLRGKPRKIALGTRLGCKAPGLPPRRFSA